MKAPHVTKFVLFTAIANGAALGPFSVVLALERADDSGRNWNVSGYLQEPKKQLHGMRFTILYRTHD